MFQHVQTYFHVGQIFFVVLVCVCIFMINIEEEKKVSQVIITRDKIQYEEKEEKVNYTMICRMENERVDLSY